MTNEKKRDPEKRTSLVDLDDPLDVDIIEPAPETARGGDSATLAAAMEQAEERATIPPTASYDMLRDSCKFPIAAEIPLEDPPEPIETSGVHAAAKPVKSDAPPTTRRVGDGGRSK